MRQRIGGGQSGVLKATGLGNWSYDEGGTYEDGCQESLCV